MKGPRFHGKEWTDLNTEQRQSIKTELMELLAAEIENIENAVNELFINSDVPIRVRVSATIEEAH